MRLSLRFLFLLGPALAVVLTGYFGLMTRLENGWLMNDLNGRANLIAQSLREPVTDAIQRHDKTGLTKTINRFSADSRFMALGVCNSAGEWLVRTNEFPRNETCVKLSNETKQRGVFLTLDGQPWHISEFVLLDDAAQLRLGELFVVHLASGFAAKQGMLTRRYALAAFLVLVFVVCLVTIVIHQWSVSQPVEKVSQAISALLRGDANKLGALVKGKEVGPVLRALMKGDAAKAKRLLKGTGLEPYVAEMNEMISRLKANTVVATSGWDSAKLRNEVSEFFGEGKVCVVANREPYIHNRKGKQIEVQWPASGLVTALEPIVRACSGLWIGHGSGNADRETADKRGMILVPPGKPEYALKRVWLTPEEEQGYYYGFANEGLWPLCHIAHTRPIFREQDWTYYKSVNEKFANAFSDEMRIDSPIALIQDYHFALLPGILRRKRPDAMTSLFWHIPWPNPEVIRICPWRTELLEGMLGADLLGFHIQYHCNNFLDTVDRYLEARVDRESFSVTYKGHTCYIRPFPISVEYPPRYEMAVEDMKTTRQAIVEELGIANDALLALGVDRLDYTKGIVERLLAVERCLELHPELVGKLVFVQIASPSRTHIKRYQELETEVRSEAQRINFRFRRDAYEPIVLKISHHSAQEVFRYYAAADACVVTALHDGMNLVAKEYIAARKDERGVLVLSSFTGAATELKDALVVNPYNTEESANAIFHALTMPEMEQQLRMHRLRAQVASNNIYTWAGQFLAEVKRISDLNATKIHFTNAV